MLLLLLLLVLGYGQLQPAMPCLAFSCRLVGSNNAVGAGLLHREAEKEEGGEGGV